MKNTVIILSVLFTVLGSFTLLADASTSVESPAELFGVGATDAPVELPAEWRWKREPVRFDHMYMREDARTRRLGRSYY